MVGKDRPNGYYVAIVVAARLKYQVLFSGANRMQSPLLVGVESAKVIHFRIILLLVV